MATEKDQNLTDLSIESYCYNLGRPELSLWYLARATVKQPFFLGTKILLAFSSKNFTFPLSLKPVLLRPSADECYHVPSQSNLVLCFPSPTSAVFQASRALGLKP